MSKYWVGRDAKPNGDHEMHVASCSRMPSAGEMLELGEFVTCYGAMSAAHTRYWQVNGCAHCSRDCHTG